MPNPTGKNQYSKGGKAASKSGAKKKKGPPRMKVTAAQKAAYSKMLSSPTLNRSRGQRNSRNKGLIKY